MSAVLVFGEIADGRLAPASKEAATAGAQLAQALNVPLIGALIGDNAAAAATQFTGGFQQTYVAEGAHYRPYQAQVYRQAAQKIIATAAPALVLFAHTLETREWVAQLAAQLDTGLVMDCTALKIEGRQLIVTKPVYGGGVWAEYAVHGTPALATVRAAVFEPAATPAATDIVRVETPAPSAGRITYLDQAATGAAGGPKLKDATLIVSGGRGVGGREHWHCIEEAAQALNAAVGCSRPVADSGWVPSTHQVGLSGTLVAPDLYIAAGISGAVQHLAGIAAAKTVVAINTDAEAEIFTRADYGIVGDCREVLPAMVERIRQLRG